MLAMLAQTSRQVEDRHFARPGSGAQSRPEAPLSRSGQNWRKRRTVWTFIPFGTILWNCVVNGISCPVREMSSREIRTAKDMGAAIRAARKRAGLTLAECAGANGVGVRFLSELERGKETAALGLALRIATSLGLRLEAAEGGEP